MRRHPHPIVGAAALLLAALAVALLGVGGLAARQDSVAMPGPCDDTPRAGSPSSWSECSDGAAGTPRGMAPCGTPMMTSPMAGGGPGRHHSGTPIAGPPCSGQGVSTPLVEDHCNVAEISTHRAGMGSERMRLGSPDAAGCTTATCLASC